MGYLSAVEYYGVVCNIRRFVIDLNWSLPDQYNVDMRLSSVKSNRFPCGEAIAASFTGTYLQ